MALPFNTSFLGRYEAEGLGDFRVTDPFGGTRLPARGSNFAAIPSLSRSYSVPSLSSVRQSQAGRTLRRPSTSEMFYGNRTPEGILQTGFGQSRPKLLSFRNFTSKWVPGRSGLLVPNPSYMGGAGSFSPSYASQLGFGRFPRYTNWGNLAKATV